MSTFPKPRSEAKLKTLPEKRQEQIIEHLRSHKHAETRDWLRQDGIETSTSALSRFWDWWHLQQQFKADEQTTDELLAELKRDVPQISDEKLDAIGQRTFSLLAIRRQDADTFVKVRSAKTKFEIEQKKVQLREKAEARMTERLKLEVRKVAIMEATTKAKQAVEETAAKKSVKLDPQTKKEILDAIDKKLLGD